MGRGLSQLGNWMFHQKNSAQDMMHKPVCCSDEAANHQLPITVASESSDSFCRGMFKLHANFDADSLLYSLSHFECDSHTVHRLTQQHLPPHWLVQWSGRCSHMCTPVHSPWLPGYIDVVQTILVILTMAGLFLDRPLTHYLTSFLTKTMGEYFITIFSND